LEAPRHLQKTTLLGPSVQCVREELRELHELVAVLSACAVVHEHAQPVEDVPYLRKSSTSTRTSFAGALQL
jgi:hypothetical protein